MFSSKVANSLAKTLFTAFALVSCLMLCLVMLPAQLFNGPSNCFLCMIYDVYHQGGSAAAVFRISSTNVEMRRIADFYRQQDDLVAPPLPLVQQQQQQPARNFPPLVIGSSGTANVH